MIGIIFDIILVAIIALNVFICYRKGLVKLAVGLIAVLAAIIISIVLYKPVSNIIIENTEFDEKIENTIIENFSVEVEEQQEETDNGFMKYMEKYVNDSVNKTRNQIVLEASNVIATKVINICAFLGIFIIARLVLILLTFVADIIMSLPILKQFNKAGGIIYGLIKALLIIYVILAIIFFIIYISGNTTLSNAISSSYITKFFYNNNLLLNSLSSFITIFPSV